MSTSMWKPATAIREDANDFHPVIQLGDGERFLIYPGETQSTYAEAMEAAAELAWARNVWRRLRLVFRRS